MGQALKQQPLRGMLTSINIARQQEPAGLKKILTVGFVDRNLSDLLNDGGYIELRYPTIESLVERFTTDFESEPDCVVCCDSLFDEEIKQVVSFFHADPAYENLPIVLITDHIFIKTRTELFNLGLDDVIDVDTPADLFYERVDIIRKTKFRLSSFTEEDLKLNIGKIDVNINIFKRIGDIVISSFLLIALTPLFLIIALLIRLESRGPIFYTSKRAGAGYKIFDFYKFRSMAIDADKHIEDLSHLNQYDGDDSNGVFVKLKGDPRVTKIGAFIRKTSIDELPQLINVLKGDMSLVGNRPLPLYEAQQLTRDNWVARFNAPAGITGLWQITKRGKADMSEEERVNLDVEYSSKHSFWYDAWILIRTIPVIFQEDDV